MRNRATTSWGRRASVRAASRAIPTIGLVSVPGSETRVRRRREAAARGPADERFAACRSCLPVAADSRAIASPRHRPTSGPKRSPGLGRPRDRNARKPPVRRRRSAAGLGRLLPPWRRRRARHAFGDFAMGELRWLLPVPPVADPRNRDRIRHPQSSAWAWVAVTER